MFQTGGFPDLDLSFLFCPFLSFLGLSRFFWDFPDLLGDGLGIFPIVLFLFLGLLRAPTRNSPERVRDTIWTFPKKSGKHPGLETPRFSFSQFLQFSPWPKTEGQSTATTSKCSAKTKFSWNENKRRRMRKTKKKGRQAEPKTKKKKSNETNASKMQSRQGNTKKFTPTPSPPTPLRTSQRDNTFCKFWGVHGGSRRVLIGGSLLTYSQRFYAYRLSYSWASLLTVRFASFIHTYNDTVRTFLAHNGKSLNIPTTGKDAPMVGKKENICKQRSSVVSWQLPSVSKRTSIRVLIGFCIAGRHR